MSLPGAALLTIGAVIGAGAAASGSTERGGKSSRGGGRSRFITIEYEGSLGLLARERVGGPSSTGVVSTTLVRRSGGGTKARGSGRDTSSFESTGALRRSGEGVRAGVSR